MCDRCFCIVDEERNKVEMEGLNVWICLMYRSLSIGEGEGG